MQLLVQLALAALVVAAPTFLVWASWRGRVKVQCCGVDARHDKRMAAAFADEPPARSAERSAGR